MSKASIHDAKWYAWGAGCEGWHLLDGADLSVIEERVPPGAAETRHRHLQARQFFYLLMGAVALEVDGTVYQLRPGEGLHVPPGAAHQLRNEGGVDARFLVISAPKSHGDRSEAQA